MPYSSSEPRHSRFYAAQNLGHHSLMGLPVPDLFCPQSLVLAFPWIIFSWPRDFSLNLFLNICVRCASTLFLLCVISYVLKTKFSNIIWDLLVIFQVSLCLPKSKLSKGIERENTDYHPPLHTTYKTLTSLERYEILLLFVNTHRYRWMKTGHVGGTFIWWTRVASAPQRKEGSRIAAWCHQLSGLYMAASLTITLHSYFPPANWENVYKWTQDLKTLPMPISQCISTQRHSRSPL